MTDQDKQQEIAASLQSIEGLLLDVTSAGIAGLSTFLSTFKQKREGRHRRRAGGSHTAAEWAGLRRKYAFTCLRCGRREPEIHLTRDHIDPRGTNYIENIQPLCDECNGAKGDQNIDYRATEYARQALAEATGSDNLRGSQR
jgi:5-methylcytosine-specific restriction endonuclease McrA